jgi:serine/threonine-protein kinase SRPK3
MIQQSSEPAIRSFFNEAGDWIVDYPVPDTTLENFVTTIPPGEERTQFLNFIRKIFTWDPAKRMTSKQFWEDEWVTAKLRADGNLPSEI